MVRAISWPRCESAPRIRVYPPLGILDRHPDHARGHVTSRHRPASTAAGAAVVCLGDHSPVPAENRVRRDDAGDLHPDAPSELLTAYGESTALGIGQAKRPRAQVLPEDPILLPEIVDQIVLVTVHPASEREDEELSRRYCQVDEKLVDRPPRYWARASREPAMLGIKNGRRPQLDCEHHSATCRGRSVTLVGAGGWWPDPQLD